VRTILATKPATIDAARLIEIYDHHEHAMEQAEPHRRFRDIAGSALRQAMQELGTPPDERDIAVLTDAIGRMPPFPEVVATLAALKAAGFRLCIISNTDDDIIAGNVAQLGGHIDRVITAQQAGAYKPSHRIFQHAHRALGVGPDDVVHVCASPHLDLVATQALGLRDVWIDRGTGRRPAGGYQPDAVLPTLASLVPENRANESEDGKQPRRHEMGGVLTWERGVHFAEVDRALAMIRTEAELAVGRALPEPAELVVCVRRRGRTASERLGAPVERHPRRRFAGHDRQADLARYGEQGVARAFAVAHR